MPSNSDTVLRLAQDYLADVPTIVLGSGASIPHDIPGMGGLTKYLTANVRPATPDDEDAWHQVLKHLNNGVDLESALNRIAVSPSLLRAVVTSTWQLLNQADMKLYTSLIEGGARLPLADLFRCFSRTSSPTIAVLTTNYDRIAEYAANLAECEPFTGFSTSLLSEFSSIDRYRDPPVIAKPPSRQRVSIWKVHGSLGWFRRSDGKIIATAPLSALPAGLDPLIVAPGLQKYQTTHSDPFRTCMTQSDAVVGAAKSFLCIGYGFNDEHVQEKMMARVRQGKPIVVLTHSLTPAARRILLTNPPPKFLLLEQGPTGTKAFHPGAKTGEELDHPTLWTLAGFVNDCFKAEHP